MTPPPLIDIHTHSRKEGAVCLVSYSYGMDPPEVAQGFFSAGIHPWSAGKVNIEEAFDFLNNAPCAAIGETGLDHIAETDSQLQEDIFRAQLDIASLRNLPVILHCVKAYNEVLNKLKDYELPAVIFHGYTGSPQQTRQIIDRGYYLSFGHRTFASLKTVESLTDAPSDLIFAETDTGDMALTEIYRKMAEVRGVDFEEIAGTIYNNYKRVFPNEL